MSLDLNIAVELLDEGRMHRSGRTFAGARPLLGRPLPGTPALTGIRGSTAVSTTSSIDLNINLDNPGGLGDVGVNNDIPVHEAAAPSTWGSWFGPKNGNLRARPNMGRGRYQ